MAKSTKQRKADARAVTEAKRFTPGKIFRLVLKSAGFAIVVSLLIGLLSVIGLPVLGNFWWQLAVMVVVYLLAYPLLMSEFRPKRGER